MCAHLRFKAGNTDVARLGKPEKFQEPRSERVRVSRPLKRSSGGNPALSRSAVRENLHFTRVGSGSCIIYYYQALSGRPVREKNAYHQTVALRGAGSGADRYGSAKRLPAGDELRTRENGPKTLYLRATRPADGDDAADTIGNGLNVAAARTSDWESYGRRSCWPPS